MNITIFGAGYVGLVTAACLAEVGNNVLCVDVDSHRVERLQQGEAPIYEPGLDALLKRNADCGRLRFTTDVAKAVAHGLVQFIAVGTPLDEDSSTDLRYVLAVVRGIGEQMRESRIVIIKSTVPVGTADRVREALFASLAARGIDLEFDVVSNPEFLREGAAIEDFMHPDRIIIGASNTRVVERMRRLYSPFNRNYDRMIVMDARSAELTKYAANAMLATKISFMNEMAGLAERLGGDIEQVRRGIGSDPRIGYDFIHPGCGYGGSCLPKDVSSLEYTARTVNYQARLLLAVQSINRRQKEVLFQKIQRHFGGVDNLRGRCLALWGLAFKPNTDDIREAPSRVLIEALWAAGATVRVFDPKAMDSVRRSYGERPDLVLCPDRNQALEGADALVVVTEWTIFRSPDFEAMKSTLRQPVVFDGRNLYDPVQMRRMGFVYYAIGRVQGS